MTKAPQPLAVCTMASAPSRNNGHQASILRAARAGGRAPAHPGGNPAPQQPAAAASVTLIPRRSRTRAAAALVFGDSAGCTQPSSSSTAPRMPGLRPPARRRDPTAACPASPQAAEASAARQRRPARRTAPGAGPAGTARRAAGTGSRAAGVRRRVAARPSSSLWYSTPDGQVVSRLRQLRQRSRCRRVRSLASSRSRNCLIQVDPSARAVEFVAPAPGRSGRWRCRNRSARSCAGCSASAASARCRAESQGWFACFPQSSAYIRPGLKMPCGSGWRLSARCRPGAQSQAVAAGTAHRDGRRGSRWRDRHERRPTRGCPRPARRSSASAAPRPQSSN